MLLVLVRSVQHMVLHYRVLTGCSDGNVRLTGAPPNISRYGRLEVCDSGLWYSVCADESFCSLTAKVVCRQLGYSTTGEHAHTLHAYDDIIRLTILRLS